MSHCAYDSTDFGQVYWGLDLPQSVMSACSVRLDDLASGKCAHTVNRYRYRPVLVHSTRTCGNRLAWCDNGRLVSKYSCLNGRLIFTDSIQTVEFVNGWVVGVELPNDPLPTTFPLFFKCPLTCLNHTVKCPYKFAVCLNHNIFDGSILPLLFCHLHSSSSLTSSSYQYRSCYLQYTLYLDVIISLMLLTLMLKMYFFNAIPLLTITSSIVIFPHLPPPPYH